MSNVDDFLQEVLRKKAPTELDDLLEFYALCARAKGNSEKTIAHTTTVIKLLSDYLNNQGLPTDAREIYHRQIRGFILNLQHRSRFAHHPYAKPQNSALSPRSVNSYLRALRAAWNGWVSEGLVETSPFTRVKIPKAPPTLIATFSESQLSDFFRAIDVSTPEGFRDYTLFLMYLDTLARLSEIATLRLEDIDLKQRTARVTGKGRRQRIVVFGVRVQKHLWKYIRLFRPTPVLPIHDVIFLTRDGYPLTKNLIERRMHHYGKKAKIEGVRCSPHTLRHTGCLLWLRRGGDIFTLQRLTGHSSLEVLKGYLNLAQSDIGSAHSRYSPVDNLQLARCK